MLVRRSGDYEVEHIQRTEGLMGVVRIYRIASKWV